MYAALLIFHRAEGKAENWDSSSGFATFSVTLGK